MVTVLEARPTMLPPEELLTDVLPTDRLTATGMAVPELRVELRRIADLRNVGSVVATWAQALGTVALAVWIGHPLAYAAAFLLMGPAFARFAILGHEAAHKLLFTNKRWNDAIGRWVVAYPSFVALDAYRRGHFAHHKDEFGPNEPDMNLYNGYPITEASFRRKMWRDARGTSGWKNLKGLLLALKSPTGRTIAIRIIVMQVPLIAAAILVGRWWLYPLLWLGPWLTHLARDQPAAVDRRARRHGALEGSPPDHAPRAPDVDRPVLHGAAEHRLAPRPPRRHGCPVAQPPPAPRRARSRRLRHRRTDVPQLPRPLARPPLAPGAERHRQFLSHLAAKTAAN